MKVKIVNASRFELPRYQTPLSAGMDVRANLDTPVTLQPLQRAMIPTGLYVSLWPGQSPEEFMLGAYLGADALNSDRAVEVKNWLDKNAPWIRYK